MTHLDLFSGIGGIEMDKMSYAILHYLLQNQAKTPISALTRREIIGGVEIKIKALILRLDRLIKAKCVKKGVQEGRAHTYYITPAGEKALEEAMKQ
jgi:predicted transcriptional regulator